MKNKPSLVKIAIGIFVGILLNVIPMYLVQYVFKLPFFMDTIGSIAVTFAFGGIPGLICAIITEFLLFYVEQYISWVICLYGLTVWASVGIVALFNKSLRESESTASVLIMLFIISILMAVVVSVVGGIVNSVDSYYQNYKGLMGDSTKAVSYFKNDLLKSGFSQTGSNILSRVPSNLIERPITTFAAYGLALLGKRTKILYS